MHLRVGDYAHIFYFYQIFERAVRAKNRKNTLKKVFFNTRKYFKKLLGVHERGAENKAQRLAYFFKLF